MSETTPSVFQCFRHICAKRHQRPSRGDSFAGVLFADGFPDVTIPSVERRFRALLTEQSTPFAYVPVALVVAVESIAEVPDWAMPHFTLRHVD